MSEIKIENKTPTATPTAIPPKIITPSVFRLAVRLNVPELITASIATTKIAPTASLNADSLITVCFTLSFIFIFLNTGTKVAGSVEATTAPSKSPYIIGILKI